MGNGSNQHSITPHETVDAGTVRVLRAVHSVAAALDCPFFVAGATARDLILVNVYGLKPGRATRDIDFGISVATWDVFRTLKANFLASTHFAEDSKAQQRLVYTDPAARFSIPIDLIPFRSVSAANQTIEWPPGRDIGLNAAGFEEAWASSMPIAVEDDLVV